MSYITLKLPFNTNGNIAGELLSTAWWFKTATHKVLAIAKQQQDLPNNKIGWKSMFSKIAYGIIPNSEYADGVVSLVLGVYESCRALGIDFKSVELGDWLMFQQSKLKYPASSIMLKPGYGFYISTIGYNGTKNKIVLKPTVAGDYRELLSAILRGRVKYMGRVVIRDYGTRDNQLWVHGEVHVIVPLDFYYRHMTRHRRNNGRLFGGIDVNADRINLAIVDKRGRLIDHRTFWFNEATARGFPRNKAWGIISMRVHELLGYAYNHGVRTLFLENPEVLGRLRLVWVRNGEKKHRNFNYKVMVFRSSIIEKIVMKAPLYSIRTGYVSPKGTSSSPKHDRIMRKYGLDRHTASAYLIVLKGLGK